ncbi:sigma-E factor negative regulatory protein [Arenimonas sp.]|uniref:sigma-E factor negative regulatory protein n=1 Tax=Arenimonas sp. TaxID=1872635 RepID=UPI0039E267F4
MNPHTNELDETIRAQLCAWMDGELPADEARFLERRLATDAALRATWERMQLASACLKGQVFRPMPSTLADEVSAALASTPAKKGFWWGHAVAASVVLLALAIAPRVLKSPDRGDIADPAIAAASVPTNAVATPASADLVAVAPSMASTASPADGDAPAATVAAPVRMTASSTDAVRVALGAAPALRETPLPLDAAQSPADFPLVETGTKAWPKSPLARSANDPALEAYLVRHNQMLAGDSLGGFVPYVDVVANGTSEAGDAAAADATKDAQR